MKLIKVLWIVISLGICPVSKSQNIDETYRYALEQYDLGNQRAAEKAFERVLYFDHDNTYRSACILKLSEIASSAKDQLTTLNYLDQAYFLTDDVQQQLDIQFERVRIFIRLQDYQKALAELYQMNADLQTERVALYEGYCQYMLKDFLAAESAFNVLCDNPSQKEALSKLIVRAEKIEKINPQTYQILSYILPGFGQILLGDTKNSLNSVLLNGVLVVLFIDTARKLSLFDASISVLPWLFRYYSGGAKLTKQLAVEKKEAKHQENLMKLIGILVETPKNIKG